MGEPDISIHESAFVDEGATIGFGTKIWHFCHVCSGAKIGKNCSLGQNVFVGPRVVIGDNVKVQNNVSLYDGVTVDDFAFLGPSAVFTNVFNPRSEVSRKHEFRPTHVGRGATIGANATIVCGTSLGKYCFVAAGSVVTRDIEDYALVSGVPARRTGWMCACGIKLQFSHGEDRFACSACKRNYYMKDKKVINIDSEKE